MSDNPETAIQVSGGGSGIGIAALITGNTDICETSRLLNHKEMKRAKKKGVNPFPIAVARDGIAFYVHTDNPIERFSLEQLKSIYTGKIDNWSELGGPDRPIVMYGRESHSGTYAFFRTRVLEGKNQDKKVQSLPGTAAIVNAVAKDRNGIGYGGIAYAEGIKTVSLASDSDGPAVKPTRAHVADGTYPVSRDLYWIVNGEPEGEVKNLVDWVLSEEGQSLAAIAGYVPRLPERSQAIQSR